MRHGAMLSVTSLVRTDSSIPRFLSLPGAFASSGDQARYDGGDGVSRQQPVDTRADCVSEGATTNASDSGRKEPAKLYASNNNFIASLSSSLPRFSSSQKPFPVVFKVYRRCLYLQLLLPIRPNLTFCRSSNRARPPWLDPGNTEVTTEAT